MALYCLRPCKRTWKGKLFLAAVTVSILWFIGFNSMWIRVVKLNQGREGVLGRLQKKISFSDLLSYETNVPAIKLLGRLQHDNVFLTIGIPTVCRVHQSYLPTTLTSIINNSAMADRHRIHIVVAVSFLNQTCALKIRDIIKELFNSYVESGLLEVIGIPEEAYPQTHDLRRTFNDEEYRVQWRSKQNVDYSFLMMYNANKAKYYIHLEDDVTTVPGYLREIENYIKAIDTYWAMLEFSSLGFIGKLFRSSDLQKIANLLRNFYSEQPCDYLMIHFMNLMVQNGRFVKIPTLFQHHGLHSSLPNLLRNVSDKFYAMGEKTLNGDNPPVKIYSSFKTHSDYQPMNAYDKNKNSFFWALTPNVGDTLTLVFKTPQCIERLVILSGFPAKASDIITGGIVEIGNKPIILADDNVYCSGLRYLGEIHHGKIDVNNITSSSGCIQHAMETSCIKLTLTERHTNWVVITEIAVFTFH